MPHRSFRPLRSWFLLFLFASGILFLTPSCGSSKTGCPANEKADSVKLNKKGEMSMKRGKSNLFPKNMRKKY